MIKAAGRALFAIAAAVALFWMAGLAVSAVERKRQDETFKELDLFADVLAFVQAQYVEEVKPKDLIYGALSGMISGLDPHSQFLIPEEYDDLKVDTEGKFGGIGIEITMKDDLITVITPIEGTPAWEAGLQSNDRIVKIDDNVVRNFTLNEAVKRMRGAPGTEVAIVVWREKEGRLYSFKIRRAMIDVKDIKDARILEDGIGYVKLVEFRDDTPQELDKALKDLANRGMDSIIFDLRNNPGGLLDKATAVCERFLKPGTTIVSVKGRMADQNAEFKSNFKTPNLDMPMILLVNGGSASGSEIVAGALKDHKRAILLGTKTFGKGSVQTVLPLTDGSAIKLTTSHYFTPLGHSIHDAGIGPDIVVEDVRLAEAAEKGEAKKKEEIFEQVEEQRSDGKQETPQKLYLSDPQLARAVDLIKSIKIFKSFKSS